MGRWGGGGSGSFQPAGSATWRSQWTTCAASANACRCGTAQRHMVAHVAHPRSAPDTPYSPLPHLHWDWARRCHICTGTGLIRATSALGLDSPLPHLRWDWLAPATSALGLGSPLPHLHREWAHPCRCQICVGTGLAASTSAPGLRLPADPGRRFDCRDRAHAIDGDGSGFPRRGRLIAAAPARCAAPPAAAGSCVHAHACQAGLRASRPQEASRGRGPRVSAKCAQGPGARQVIGACGRAGRGTTGSGGWARSREGGGKGGGDGGDGGNG